MSENTALANRQETGMARVKNYMLSPEVKGRFTEMMGAEAIYYLNQVLIVVANSDELQKCDPKSILVSAMRAASLKLSVDPGQGQAWIIPYKGKATFQIGYKGVYELALRTNLYRFINVIDIYEGEQVIENRMTGIHNIAGAPRSSKEGEPPKVIARMLYFKLLTGFEKTFVMSVEEIDAHARHYSQGYNNPRSKWHDPQERPKMERKTVLVNGLRKWGRFNSTDRQLLEEIETEGIVSGDRLPNEDEVTPPPPAPRRSEAEIMGDLGFEPDHSDEPEPEPESTEPAVTVDPLRYQPDALKTRLAQMGASMNGEMTKGKFGLIQGTLEAALSHTPDPKASRKQLLVFLTGKDSLSDIPVGMQLALYKWLSPAQDPASGEWMAEAMAAREAVAAFNAAQPQQSTLL